MRRTVLALAIVLEFAGAIALGGCKHQGSAKLEGRWRGTRADGVAPQAQDAANAFARETEIVAKGNVITITTPPQPVGRDVKSQQAVYVVDDENKGTLVLHTDKDGVANKETFAFGDDGKTMTWRLGEGRSIVFAKQN